MSTKLLTLAALALVTTSTSTAQPLSSTDLASTNSSNARELTAEASGCWRVQSVVDLIGADVGFLKAKNPGPCSSHCSKTGSCDMLTWTNYDGGRCWLKKSSGQIKGTASSGAWSMIYVKGCTRADVSLGKCEITDSKNDLGAQRAGKPAQCYGLCDSTQLCKAFTWTPYNGGTCFLKSAPSTCKPSATGESGVLFSF